MAIINNIVENRHRDSLLDTTPNPFENKAPSGAYEVIKMIICFFLLFPFRLVLLILAWVCQAILCRFAVSCGGASMVNDRGCIRHLEPLAPWRRVILWPMPLFFRTYLWCFGFWWIKVTDRRKDKSVRPNILTVAPHESMMDPAIISYLFPPMPSEVGQSGLLEGAVGCVLGPISIAGQAIYVDRTMKESRVACKQALAERADEKWTGPPTMIFPEGTTTNGRALVMFKAGAFAPGKAVQPVTLRYPYKHLCLGWTGDFAPGAGMIKLLLRMMLQFANFAEVEIMEPYIPSEEEKKDSFLYAANVRAMMAAALGVTTTEHTQADVGFSMKAIPGNVESNFVMSDMIKKLGFTNDQLLDFLKEFKKADRDKSGSISFEEAKKIVDQTGSKALQNPIVFKHIFDLFDTDHSGFLSYLEMVQALSTLSQEDSGGYSKLLFLLCNPADDGKVTRASLLETIKEGDHDGQVKGKVEQLPETVDFETFATFVKSTPEVGKVLMGLVPEWANIYRPGGTHGVDVEMGAKGGKETQS